MERYRVFKCKLMRVCVCVCHDSALVFLMTESCFVYKHMVCHLGHVLVLSCYVTPPPRYPRLVIIV